MTNRIWLVCLAVLVGCASGTGPVSAQLSSSGPQYHDTGIRTNSNNQSVDRTGSPLYFGGPSTANAVFLGGTPIMRVRVAADGYSPAQRASQIQERLNNLLGMGSITADEITTQQVGADAVVMVKGHLLFTADSATAQFNSTTPIALANTWADHVRKLLPALTEAK